MENNKHKLVGAPRFELGTSCAQGRRATRLRYAPTCIVLLILKHFPTLLLIRTIKKARKGLDELATEGSGKKPIHPQYVVRMLDELAAEDAIFSCDVGTPTIWPARYLTMNGKRRLLGSFNHGSMAN